MGMSLDTLPDRLTLILKTLMVSRSALAKALGVDKSLVGRWASGKVKPSSHNLAELTRWVAVHVPGFTMLDWDSAPDAFAERLSRAMAATGLAAAAAAWFPAAILEQASAGVRSRGLAYEGFWRSIRPSHDLPGRFLQDVTLIRRDEAAGRFVFWTRIEGMTLEGWSLLLQNQFFSVSADLNGLGLVFGIFNGVARDRAEILDGVTLATLRDTGGSPASAACVMERIADPTGDPQRDMRELERLALGRPRLMDPDAVPAPVRALLARDVTAGPPGFLRLLTSQSLARGRRFEAP